MATRTFVLILAFAASLLAASSVVEDAKKKAADKKYDEAITELETAYKGKATPELKKALADTWYAKAESFMYNDSLPPRVKYPTALKSYREVLKYDKDNKKAQQNVATIEGIYKSMGRPVPQ